MKQTPALPKGLLVNRGARQELCAKLRHNSPVATDADTLSVQPPHAELLDMRDPGATAKGFPDVCGETPPATFQFVPATGAEHALPHVSRRHDQ